MPMSALLTASSNVRCLCSVDRSCTKLALTFYTFPAGGGSGTEKDV